MFKHERLKQGNQRLSKWWIDDCNSHLLHWSS